MVGKIEVLIYKNILKKSRIVSGNDWGIINPPKDPNPT
jgi:hypothetical protein